MKTKEEYKEEIQKLKGQYIKDYCEYEINDIVKIEGYSHMGKRGIIRTIKAEILYDGRIRYKVFGSVLKSDGSPGLNFFDFTEDDKSMYEKE
jgi:hypothetical protein